MTEKHLDRRNAQSEHQTHFVETFLSIYSRFQCSMPPHHLLTYKIHESYAISVSIVLSTSHAFHHSRCSRAFGKILKPGEFNGGGTAAGWSSVFFVWIEFNFPTPWVISQTNYIDWISRWVFHPQGLVGDDNFHKIHSDSPAADRAGPPSHPGGLARQKTNFYKRVVVLKDHGFGSDFKGIFLKENSSLVKDDMIFWYFLPPFAQEWRSRFDSTRCHADARQWLSWRAGLVECWSRLVRDSRN